MLHNFYDRINLEIWLNVCGKSSSLFVAFEKGVTRIVREACYVL